MWIHWRMGSDGDMRKRDTVIETKQQCGHVQVSSENEEDTPKIWIQICNFSGEHIW
jgi:hypothetical protein